MFRSGIKTLAFLPVVTAFGCSSVSITRNLERSIDVGSANEIALTVVSPNGGVRIEEDDRRSDILVVAEARSRAATESAAENRMDAFDVLIEPVTDRHWRIEPDFAGRRRGGDAMGFLITVPRLDDAVVRTDNGSIVIRSAHGELDLETGNGAVQVGPTSGSVVVKTGNGNISCVTGDSSEPASIDLRTGNGRIRLDLPERRVAELFASTGNGRIEDRLESGEVLASTRSGSLRSQGTGTSGIELRTGNGSIHITRSVDRVDADAS